MSDAWEKLQVGRAQAEAERREQEERAREKAASEQREEEARQQAARAADALATRVFERFKVILEEIRSKDPGIRAARESAVVAYPRELAFVGPAGGIVELRWGDRLPPYDSRDGDYGSSIYKPLAAAPAYQPKPTPYVYHFVHLDANSGVSYLHVRRRLHSGSDAVKGKAYWVEDEGHYFANEDLLRDASPLYEAIGWLLVDPPRG